MKFFMGRIKLALKLLVIAIGVIILSWMFVNWHIWLDALDYSIFGEIR